MARYSLIIRDGAVFDGKGNEPIVADLAVRDGRIAGLGDMAGDRGTIEIDAAGRYVTPGFIDLTTHSDTHWSLFFYPLQESFFRQGVTTIVGGNCGLSLAPILGVKAIEELGAWVDLKEANLNWQTVREFLEELTRHPLGVNFATLVGLTTIHKSAAGAGSEDEILGAMETLVKRSLEEGAFGVSTNFSLLDMRSVADTSILHLARLVERKGGLMKHHLEDEGRELLPSLSRVISLSRASGVRTHISHFRSLGKTSWPSFPHALEMIDRARGEGVPVTCDFYPYTNTDTELLFLLPSWARRKGREELRQILSDRRHPERVEVLKHLSGLTLHYEATYLASGTKEVPLTGVTLEAMGRRLGLAPEETVIHLLLATDFSVRIFNESIIVENVERAAGEPFAAIASDGVGYEVARYPARRDKADEPHPRSFGTFPHALETLARDRAVLTWAEALRRMTSLPAAVLGLKDRGVIEKGKVADLVVLNPVTLEAKPNYKEPFQFPAGIEHVIINGELVLGEGTPTGLLAGQILRRL